MENKGKKFQEAIQILVNFTSSQKKAGNNIFKGMKESRVVEANFAVKTDEKNIADNYFKEQVKKPGMFFCLESVEDWQEAEIFIRNFLKDYPQLKVLVYFSGRKTESKPVAMHLLVTDKRDFDLFGREKPLLKTWLKEQHFDLLLVFARNRDKRCCRLATAIKARLKAGWTFNNEEPLLDISLGKPGEEMHYDTFYNEFKKYFKQLNLKLVS